MLETALTWRECGRRERGENRDDVRRGKEARKQTRNKGKERQKNTAGRKVKQ
jgi:hypothetical protein